ncbi:hypothetical protein HC031_01135 [Planosporangium thailandense]|uniref:DNA primase n=1 Tax=Planosporangium thailandense TaxID=765197 RepID=A0ABX0XSR8_9ACTN|nr:hypothetical protein [Planosporangium thailandense]NJC68330.1 hypothetical protein [Planosporangium thailandense]
MKDSVKLGAAVAGGYLLGRTKKGKAAIGLALWLSGKRIGNSREALTRLAASPELARLAAQVRGPLLEAAQRAVTATIESRTTALADSLQQRTERLIDGTVTAVRDAPPQEPPVRRTRSGRVPTARRDADAGRADEPADDTARPEPAAEARTAEPADDAARPGRPRQARPRRRAPRRAADGV